MAIKVLVTKPSYDGAFHYLHNSLLIRHTKPSIYTFVTHTIHSSHHKHLSDQISNLPNSLELMDVICLYHLYLFFNITVISYLSSTLSVLYVCYSRVLCTHTPDTLVIRFSLNHMTTSCLTIDLPVLVNHTPVTLLISGLMTNPSTLSTCLIPELGKDTGCLKQGSSTRGRIQSTKIPGISVVPQDNVTV